MIDLKALSLDQLNSLLADLQAEIANRATAAPVKITASVPFGSYNDRRYSRPWIARITSWAVGGKAELAWGSYLGDSNGGRVEVACLAGDLIRYGQKDGRGNGGVAQYAIALEAQDVLLVNEWTAATYYRANAAERAALIRKWLDVRAERHTLMAQYETLIAEWRETNDKETYTRALAIERAAKDLSYTL